MMRSISSSADRANPIFALYRHKEELVLSTRAALFAELDATSPPLSAIARNVLDAKLGSAAFPPLGEMLPWVLADLTRVDQDRLPHVAQGWLGVYLYGHLIDQRADTRQAVTTDEQLLAWLLFQYGLRDLHAAVHGTAQAKIFDTELANAVRYQLADVRQNSEAECSSREEYSREKNSCLVACAAAIASICDLRATEIVQFTRSLRLALQFLDDVADWREDASVNNHTVLLSRALAFSSPTDLRCLSPSEVLALAVRSGALEYVLRRVSEVLAETLPILDLHRHSIDNPSKRFFVELQAEVESVHAHVKSTRPRLDALPADGELARAQILDEIEVRLAFIAQGT